MRRLNAGTSARKPTCRRRPRRPEAVTAAQEAESVGSLAKDKVDAAQARDASRRSRPGTAGRRRAPAARLCRALRVERRQRRRCGDVSPDPAVRWRILGAAVQHSSNGGSTWDAAAVGVTSELTAGTAPSATVCWLVGRNGVVLLTMDGRTWRRVPFPEITDLSGVRTVDAGGRVASVSTADGRTFVTIDAGATWTSR